jgi:hypothetical protein
LCTLIAVSGCTTYGGSKRTLKAGGWTLLPSLPLVLVGVAICDEAGTGPGQGLIGCRSSTRGGIGGTIVIIGLAAIPAGLALVAGGLAGMIFLESPAEQARHAEEKRAEEARLRDAKEEHDRGQAALREAAKQAEARILIDKAATAAASGDCTTARMLVGRIQELDEEIYNTKAITRPEIAACVGP